MSTFLYFGPTAREAASKEAATAGRLLAPPFGDDGLKVETSREIVELLSSSPVGDILGTIVVGPFDDVTPQAGDALLKTVEELDERYLRMFLWALDVEMVSATIRSRCLEVWCPSLPGYSPEAPYLGKARSLCDAALRRKRAAVVEHLKEHKGLELELLRASAEVLTKEEGWPLKARLLLWARIREVLVESKGNPTVLSTLTAFLV